MSEEKTITDLSGPAFPITHVHPQLDEEGNVVTAGMKGKEGLTKRELISAMAMQGILSNPVLMQAMAHAAPSDPSMGLHGIAEMAKQQADLMLKESEKNK